MKITKRQIRRIIREAIMTESGIDANKRAFELLSRDYDVVSDNTDYPYGRYRGDVKKRTVYARKDGQPVPEADINLLKNRDAMVRKDGGSMAALSGIYTSNLSNDGLEIIVNYYRHTAGQNIMKITRRQIRRIIREQEEIVAKDDIKNTVMDILSDEGGAAGLDPIEDALEDLEDDEISLPDEPIEDVVGDVTGVKRHADGDFIDTTQLEARIRKLVMREARLNERGTGNPALAKEERALTSAVVDWVDKYRMVMGMDPNDFGDDKRVKMALDDMISALIQ